VEREAADEESMIGSSIYKEQANTDMTSALNNDDLAELEAQLKSSNFK
jgi:hypothetical protein